MRRKFVMTKTFDRRWAQLGLTDAHLREIQTMLLENPHAGDVIPGLHGARKVRFGLETHGKSGGIRVIYVDIIIEQSICLLTAYPKGAQDDMTPDQKRQIRSLVDFLKEE